MSLGLRIAEFARSLMGRDQEEALRVVDADDDHDRAVRQAVAEQAPREMAALGARRGPTVTLGTSIDLEGQTFPVLLPRDEVRGGGHWLITGATGSGKSYLALALLAQLLRRRSAGIVVVDMKGELSQILREQALPALVASLPEADAARLLRRIAVVSPFDERATPPFQVLARDPTLPIELQAHEVASSFGRTIGRDLGVLQAGVLKYALLAAIDVGLCFTEVPQLLQDAALLRGVVERTRLPEVRAYFAERFPRERAGSLAALLSRLDSLLMYPTLRRMLSARGMIRFDRLLERAVTVIDLGGAPAGMRELSAFFGQLIFQKIVRATFARRVGPETLPTTIMADEFQEMLSPEIAADFERFLTLARSQRVFLWCLFQQAAQVEKVSPVLLRILRTNTNYQLMFRSSLEDAKAMSHILPVTGVVPKERPGFPDPRTPPVMLTPDEERKILVEQVPHMPDRLFWFWNRRRPYGAILTKSPTLSVKDMQARAAKLPRELAAFVRHGVLAVGKAELDTMIAERDARREEFAGRALGPAVATSPETASSEPLETVETMEAPDEETTFPSEPTATTSDAADGRENDKPRRKRGVRLG